MEQKNSKLKLLIGGIVLVALIAVMLGIYLNSRPETNAGSKNIVVEVRIPEEDSNEFKINTDAEYLREALDEINLIKGDESAYGFFITEVNGRTANSDNQEWWLITKGGEDVMVGVNDIVISDGDHYELTLVIGY